MVSIKAEHESLARDGERQFLEQGDLTRETNRGDSDVGSRTDTSVQFSLLFHLKRFLSS